MVSPSQPASSPAARPRTLIAVVLAALVLIALVDPWKEIFVDACAEHVLRLEEARDPRRRRRGDDEPVGRRLHRD